MTQAEIWLGMLTVLVLGGMADMWARQRRGTATARALARKTAECALLQGRLAAIDTAPEQSAGNEYGGLLAFVEKLELDHQAELAMLQQRLAATQRQLDDAMGYSGSDRDAIAAGRTLQRFGGGL